MEWNKKFDYPSSTRALIQGKRHYSLGGSNLPSVTAILSFTKSVEDKAALAAWKDRVGKVEADRIKKEASTRGSNLHKFIEDFLHGKLNQDLIEDNNNSKKMAEEIIDNGLKNKLTEVGEFTFDATEGIISYFLLLLLEDKQGAKFKTYPMSLKQENLPYESFNCYSQCRENLYLAYGEQKQVLAPGKYVRFKNIEDQTSTEIQVFTRKEGKYTLSLIHI